MAGNFWSRVALRPQPLNPRGRSTIRRSFIAYSGLLLLICWGFALWYIAEDHKRTVAVAGDQLRAVAASLNAQMEAMLGDGLGAAQSALGDIRERGVFADVPAAVISKQLGEQVTGNYIRGLFVGDDERTIVAGRALVDEITGPPAWLPEHPAVGQIVASPPIPDPSRSMRQVIPVARGVRLGDEVGWAGMWFDVEELLDRYRSIGIDRGNISILRADGWLLMGTAAQGRPIPSFTDLRNTHVFERIRMLPANKAYVIEDVSALDQKRKLFAVAKGSAGVPLYLVVSRDYRAALAPWRRSTMVVFWLSLGCSTVLVLMTALLYRFLEEIHRRESQFQGLFENSLESILLLKEGRIVDQNGQTLKIFRAPGRESLHGKKIEDISAATQPDGSPSARAFANHVEQLQRQGAAAFPWLFRRADSAEPFEAEVSLTTMQIAGDEVTLAIVRDISEQEAARRALRDLNAELEARVLHRTAELQHANAQLAVTNRALEEFAASASHDLRSPLSSISGQAGLLELGAHDRLDPEGLERLSRIQSAVKRASDVVDGLLALSRISRQEMQEETIDLSQIARNVIEELHEVEPKRDVACEVQPGMTVRADRGLMTSLVANLVSNAWKYSTQRPQIWIGFNREQQGRELVYCVADHGAGFSMEHATGLFQAFRRLHKAEEFSGVGIGLATVARIVTRYGGRIWADAKPNVGAKFFFTLPNAELPGEAQIDTRRRAGTDA